MFACQKCGTIELEAGECCGEQRISLEEAIGMQEQLFELSGNDRAQHVLHRLKSIYELAAQRVVKASDKLDELVRQRESTGAVLADFYKLILAPQVESSVAPSLLQKVADRVNAGELDSPGTTVRVELANERAVEIPPREACPKCKGDGRIPDKTGGGHHGTCSACGGTGEKVAERAAKPTPRIAPSEPVFVVSRLESRAGDVRSIEACVSGREKVVIAIVDCTNVAVPDSVIVPWQIRYCEAGYPDQAAWSDLCRDKGWLREPSPGSGVRSIAGPCAADWGCDSNCEGVCIAPFHCNSWQDPAKTAAADPEAASPEPAADDAPGPATGDLAATEASLIWRHARENGRYEYVSPGSGGKVAFGLKTGEGRAVLTIFGESREAADSDAAMLGVVAGTTFTYDETETAIACKARAIGYLAYVAAMPSGVAA